MEWTPEIQFRYELFEVLLPSLLFTGDEEDQESALHELKSGGNDLIYDCFAELCDMDQVTCPYEKDDFQVNYFNRGGVDFVQILLPEMEPKDDINDLLRVYLLSANNQGEQIDKYFIVKTFADTGQTFIIYKDKPMDLGTLGFELTDKLGDMEHEYWLLARQFVSLLTLQ